MRAHTNRYLTGTSPFYRAMSLFRQGNQEEARKLSIAAAAKMKPLPKDENNPLAGDADHNDLILWLALKTAHGKYVSAEDGGLNWVLRGRADAIGPWSNLLGGIPQEVLPFFVANLEMTRTCVLQ